MKKIIIIICCMLFLPLYSINAYARAQLHSLRVETFNLPDNAVYIDLMILMNEDDYNYTECNEENMKAYSFEKNQISSYNNDGFISLSCHYKEIFTDMLINPENHNNKYYSSNCFTLKNDNGTLRQGEAFLTQFIKDKRQFKIAILDKNGNIIQLSETFKVIKGKSTLNENVVYDVTNNEINISYEEASPLQFLLYINPLYYVALIILAVFIISLAIDISDFSNKEKIADKKNKLIILVIITILLLIWVLIKLSRA